MISIMMMNMKDRMRKFVKDNSGIGIVEIILILVILIALIVIFREKITAIVNTAFTNIQNDSNTILGVEK
ncbi:MAG: Flp1 family type IVb pilin [Lachnospiraceae bacterium]|nr:holin, BlyA family protein [Lachnoclostridium sp.]MDD7521146.1 Flp1 family type IVb pilin [Lachnoclostridium sp.]MDY2599808.1 Flp1 family type IVb pilin [Lachnospiraceae bacterium]